MRHTLNSGFTGVPLLDFVLLGAAMAVAFQTVSSVLSGRVPGPGLPIAAVLGGVFGVLVFIFKTGMQL